MMFGMRIDLGGGEPGGGGGLFLGWIAPSRATGGLGGFGGGGGFFRGGGGGLGGGLGGGGGLCNTKRRVLERPREHPKV